MGVKTIDELRDERAAQLDIIDDIVRTAKADKRGLTDDERTSIDTATKAADDLEAEITRAAGDAEDIVRMQSADVRRGFQAPNVNVGREAVRANRSLDELLWAAPDDVPAGSFDKTGSFRPHSVARNTVEQIIVRNEDGLAVQAPRLSAFQPASLQVVRSFQKLVADMALFGLMIDKNAKSSGQGFEVARGHRLFKGQWSEICRAMDVDTSAEGQAWVPTGIGMDLHAKVRAAGRVAALFSRIDLPTNPWKWPIEGADAVAYRVAEPTGNTESKMTASTPGTVAATFDAEIFGARTLFSRSIEADSALAILPYVQRKLVQAFVDAEEKAIIDGDTDGTHQDSDVGASTTDARTAWDGLRKRGLANASAATTTSTVANLFAIRALMGKWGLNPADLAFIVGVSAAHDLLVDTNVLTVDKIGPNATILNGQIASIGGVPVVVSEHVRENLNASGVHDGITTTKTVNICVNRNEWVMGQRMALDVEVDDSIYRETYQRVAVAFMREDFQNVGDASTNDDTAVGYNVTP